MADETEQLLLLDVDKDEEEEEEEEEEVLYEQSPGRAKQQLDPIIDAIGGFGIYQLFICCIGFFVSGHHALLSLGLKFIGMKTNFTCDPTVNHNSNLSILLPANLTFDNSCYLGAENNLSSINSSSMARQQCDAFVFDASQFDSTIVERWNLVCDKSSWVNLAQSVFFSGSLVGVILGGLISDRFGRKIVFVGFIVIFVVCGLVSRFTTSFTLWLAARFLLGFTTQGSGTSRYTIQMELISTENRTWSNISGGAGWNCGYMLLALLVYLIPNMAHLELLIALLGIPFLLCYWCHPESPKWLLSVGRTSEAEDIVRRIRSWNGLAVIPIHLTPEKRQSVSPPSASTRSSGLLSIWHYPGLRRNLVLMALSWFSVGIAYFGIALHTPEFGSNVYMVFFLGGLIDLPVTIIGAPVLNTLGRRRCMVTGLLGTAVFLSLSGLVNFYWHKEWVTIGLIITGKFCIALSFDCCYVWTVEIFPTVVRNSALSLCSGFARIGAIVAPLIVEIDKDNPMAPIMIYAGVCLCVGLLSVFIHPETNLCYNMPNTLEEGERLASRAGLDATEKTLAGHQQSTAWPTPSTDIGEQLDWDKWGDESEF